MRSQAALSSSNPPSTDCSASIECGGTRSESSCGSAWLFMARIIPLASRPKNQKRNLQNYCCKPLDSTRRQCQPWETVVARKKEEAQTGAEQATPAAEKGQAE